MPEKVVLWCRTGTWIKILAWMQMENRFTGKQVWYGLKIFLYCLALFLIIWHWSSISSKSSTDWIETESEDVAHHFNDNFALVLVITSIVFILAYILVIFMGSILLRGCKQQNVPYLKSWLIFATVSIFWHVFFMVFTQHPVEVVELIIFIPFYSFGIVIVYYHMYGILANQNPGGEELPKYETIVEEYV
ncbi:unnamed protein product [Allacma fusca]|uniref:Uncharacterized protein n=1 Tax=Allacma fusca TaxID=39272 RepID=A0A8J2P103_9HEXA|nr:unnamed protein product [Allacma fusca]